MYGIIMPQSISFGPSTPVPRHCDGALPSPAGWKLLPSVNEKRPRESVLPPTQNLSLLYSSAKAWSSANSSRVEKLLQAKATSRVSMSNNSYNNNANFRMGLLT